MLRRAQTVGLRCFCSVHPGNSTDKLKLEFLQRGFSSEIPFSRLGGINRLARQFSSNSDANLIAPAEKRSFNSLKLYEIIAKEQLASSLKRGRQLSMISSGLAAATALFISPPVLVLFAIGGYMAYRNVVRFEARSALTVTKVTITPEKDKLIFEYGIIESKQAEVEIKTLETKILQQGRKEQQFGILLSKEVTVTLLVPVEHKSVVITDRELLLAAISGKPEALENYEYRGPGTD